MKKHTKHYFEFMSVLSVFLVVAVYAMALFFGSIDTKISMMSASVVDSFDSADISEIDKFQGLYSDIDVDSKYYESAEYFYNNGFLDGVDDFRDGVFGVDEFITRGEVMKFVGEVNEFDLTSGSYDNCFVDVNGIYEPFICYAFVHGIINGGGDDDFSPNKNVKFNAFLKIILASADVDTLLPEDSELLEVDGLTQDDWTYPYVLYVLNNDVVSDFDVDALSEPVGRGDAMNMIYNLLNVSVIE